MTRLSFYLSYMALATAVAPLAGPRRRRRSRRRRRCSPASPGCAIARMNRAPLVLDVRDLWPAAATSLDQISSGLAAARSPRRSSASSTGEAAAVVAVTRPFCEHIDRIRGAAPRDGADPERHARALLRRRNGPHRLGVRRGTLPRHVRGHARDRAGAAVGARRRGAAARRAGDFAFVGDGPMKDRLVRAGARARARQRRASTRSCRSTRCRRVLAGERRAARAAVGAPDVRRLRPVEDDRLHGDRPAGDPLAPPARRRGSSSAPAAAIVVPAGGSGRARRGRAVARDTTATRRRGWASGVARSPRTRLRSTQAERLEQLLLDVARRG